MASDFMIMPLWAETVGIAGEFASDFRPSLNMHNVGGPASDITLSLMG